MTEIKRHHFTFLLVRNEWIYRISVSLSSRKVLVLEDPRGLIFKSLSLSLPSSSEVQVLENFRGLSRLTYVAWDISSTIVLQWLSDEWVAYLPLCTGQVQVHVDLTVLPHSSVVVLEESPCPWKSSRTNFQVLVLVLVLVLESQVLDNNTAKFYDIWRIWTT